MRLSNDRAQEKARDILEALIEPKLNWTLGALGLVGAIDVDDDSIKATVRLISDDSDAVESLRQQAREELRMLGRRHVYLLLTRVNVSIEGVGGIRKVVLVGSGKGGVGKSTLATNLAAALHGLGLRVGLMDADVYGPSIPTMVGAHGKPAVLPDEYLMPITAHGIKTMSVGYLAAPGRAMDWRGQVLAGTILQFIRKTFWGHLDVLIVDLPPGTGDAQLTLSNRLKTDGLIAVTTPQQVALGDVERAIDFYRRRQIPVLGLVENMAYLVCEQCENHVIAFPRRPNAKSNQSPEDLVEEIPTLARLPLLPALSEAADDGHPLALRGEHDPHAKPFWQLAREVCRRIALPLPDGPAGAAPAGEGEGDAHPTEASATHHNARKRAG